MKKLFITMVLMFTLICSAFAYNEGKRITDVGIPAHVSFIQFNNGGSVICSAEDADVSILIQSNESMLTLTRDGNKIQFYVYEIKGDITLYLGNSLTYKKVKMIRIVDSEALSFLYY